MAHALRHEVRLGQIAIAGEQSDRRIRILQRQHSRRAAMDLRES